MITVAWPRVEKYCW